MKLKIGNTTIRTIQGDITKVDFADAIVNSASNASIGGNGINSAIHKAAGKGLMMAYKKKNGCEVGEAIITPSYGLPCKCVIHTVGPVWQGGKHNEVNLLTSCYKKSLEIAENHHIKSSIAFPSISTGIHSFPLDMAAYIAVHAVFDALNDRASCIETVYWILHDPKTQAAYDKAIMILAEEHSISGTESDIQIIGFYHEYESYGCFSNWYPAEFDYAGKHFANSEQYMMYHKVSMFGRNDLAEQIMNTSDPKKCKQIAGQKFPEFKHETWESTCYTIVKRGVKAKFRQNIGIMKTLLNTGNALLAECSSKDRKWGIGIDIHNPSWRDTSKWDGKNMLGRILMEVRDELRLERMLKLISHKKAWLLASAETIGMIKGKVTSGVVYPQVWTNYPRTNYPRGLC